jgi:DNA-binding beta-propeller fold protein YncE
VFDRAEDGTLTQKPGTAGCISETGAGPCVDGKALEFATSVAVSPDGKSAYVASANSDAVAVGVFDRAGDGTLTQKPGTAGCISEAGIIDGCSDGTALTFASSVVVSPDGRSAYVTSRIGAVAIFDRTRHGRLIQKPGTAGCISGNGDGPCVDGRAFGFPESVTVSPDGLSAYVASHDSDAVLVFDRAPNGTLAQKPGTAGCIREAAPANRCVDGTALVGGSSVAVSPDGRSAYIASLDAVAVFDREPSPPPTPDTTTPVLSGLDPSPTPWR